MSKTPETPARQIPPPPKSARLVEHSTEGAPPLVRNGRETVAALYSRRDKVTGMIYDYYPRYAAVESLVVNELGAKVPMKREHAILMRRTRPGQYDPFASMGVRATGEVK